MFKTVRFIPGLILIVYIFLTSFTLVSCQKKEDTLVQNLIIYRTLCPDGVDACYDSCNVKYDEDEDGAVEAGNLKKYNSCTESCDLNCDLTWFYFLFVQE